MLTMILSHRYRQSTRSSNSNNNKSDECSSVSPVDNYGDIRRDCNAHRHQDTLPTIALSEQSSGKQLISHTYEPEVTSLQTTVASGSIRINFGSLLHTAALDVIAILTFLLYHQRTLQRCTFILQIHKLTFAPFRVTQKLLQFTNLPQKTIVSVYCYAKLLVFGVRTSIAHHGSSRVPRRKRNRLPANRRAIQVIWP